MDWAMGCERWGIGVMCVFVVQRLLKPRLTKTSVFYVVLKRVLRVLKRGKVHVVVQRVLKDIPHRPTHPTARAVGCERWCMHCIFLQAREQSHKGRERGVQRGSNLHPFIKHVSVEQLIHCVKTIYFRDASEIC